MNAAAFDPYWLQAEDVGPNGKFHRLASIVDPPLALCLLPTQLFLDPSRMYARLNPNHRKCVMCMRSLRPKDETMTYGPDPKDGTASYDDTPFAAARNATTGKPDQRAQLQARIDRHLSQADYAAAQLARLEALPTEPEVDSDEPNVIWFEKTFKNGVRSYTYAAVKTSDGLWYTSGPNTPKGYTWDRLIQWIADGPYYEVWHATDYYRLIDSSES